MIPVGGGANRLCWIKAEAANNLSLSCYGIVMLAANHIASYLDLMVHMQGGAHHATDCFVDDS
jgi:hypothetical protein